MKRQIEKNIIKGFTGYLFKSNSIRNQIKREAQGAKVLGLSVRKLENISISFPKEKKEQQKIASCLSSLDALIEAQNKKVSVLCIKYIPLFVLL
jgi:type I restriction enzyme S subunit